MRGGATLAVRGSIDQKPLKGLNIRAELVSREVDPRRIAEATVFVDEDQKLSAQLPLPNGLVGSYMVVLTAVYSGANVDSDEKIVELNTTKPIVSVATAREQVDAGERITINGTVEMSAAPVENVVVSYGDRQENVAVGSSGLFTFTTPEAMGQGTYIFSVTARDALGNTNESSPASTTVVVRPPVVRSNVVPLEEVKIVPVTRLSNDFSIPVATSLVSTGSVRQGFGVSSAQSRGDVLGSEERNLDGVIDLNADEAAEEDTPLAPTSNGWSLFGVSWYWWAAGTMTIWVATAGTRWWLQRP